MVSNGPPSPARKVENNDITVDVSQFVVDSGIGQRMLDKKTSEQHIPTNKPLKEGATPTDCQFALEIRRRDGLQFVGVDIAFPSSATPELTHNKWGVGKIENGELVFTPSFGANGDSPLTEEQKETMLSLTSKALGVELKKSEKIEY